MNVLNLEHISKIYGDKVIFDDISCGIHQGDKIGIIGINGTGKTTFLRILAGLEEADDGQVIMQNGLRISFLSQHPTFPEGATILSYVTQGQREQSWNPETEAHMVLNKLGIEEHEEEIAHLSGGQKKRVALAAVLVNPTDVLILDEPTNHLDNEMASWLEDYLNRFKGIVIMVTHDRYFLDRVTNKILEISHGKLYSYEAKYSELIYLDLLSLLFSQHTFLSILPLCSYLFQPFFTTKRPIFLQDVLKMYVVWNMLFGPASSQQDKQ